jgi:hypothetical protein
MGSLRVSSSVRALLMLGSLSSFAACEGNQEATETKADALTSADVLGFEVTGQWRITQGQAQSLTLTDTRTKGNKALAVARPSGFTRLESSKIPSSNTELAKIDRGVTALVDLMIPTEQADPLWSGAVQMYISAPSKNVHNAFIGQVELTPMRTGIYTTLAFKVPDLVADALKGKTYSDLTFGIVINVPLNSPGTYRLDNLRIRGKISAPQDPTQIGEGQSILLEPWKSYSPAGSKVAEQTFAAGVVQIPARFHPVKGRAGAGSATFAFKLGSATLVSCQYPANAAGTDYVFGSCAGGNRAGDLVPASFVRLTVVNGDPAAGKTRIKAQIALNPVGDEIVAGLPPIPTFFGTNAAEVAAALDSFVQPLRNWNAPGQVLVRLPSPHIPARDSVVINGTNLPPTRPPQDNDPPFEGHGRLTENDLGDAGWHANGSIAAPINQQGARRAEFRVDVGADVWLLGYKVSNVLGVTGQLDTVTPPPTGTSIPPSTYSGDFCLNVLGKAARCSGPYGGQVGFSDSLFDVHESVKIFELPYWVFSVKAFIDVDVAGDVSGGFTPGGFAVTLDPSVSLGARLDGEVNLLGFAGGGLSVNANILGIHAPITASISANVDLTPGTCKVHLTERLDASAHITAGDGNIKWYLFGGLCCGCAIEACARTDGKIYGWPGYNRTEPLPPLTPLLNQDIFLDPAVCPQVQDAPGNIDYPVSQQTFKQGDRSFMSAQFQIAIPDESKNPPGTIFVFLDQKTWTSSDPSDVIVGDTIRYGNPGTRLLTVVASKPNVGTGTGSVTVNVVANNPAFAPTAQILAPVAPAVFNCGTVNGSATATDPNGGTTTINWYATNAGTLNPYADPAAVLMTTGANVTFAADQPGGPAGADHHIIRVIAIDPEGNQSLAEIPALLTCVQ